MSVFIFELFHAIICRHQWKFKWQFLKEICSEKNWWSARDCQNSKRTFFFVRDAIQRDQKSGVERQITIKHQSYRIAKWEARIQDFETILATQENGSNKIIDPKPMSESNENNINAKRNLDRKSTFKYSFHYHIKVYGFYLLIHLMKKRYRREVSILDKIFIIGII